MPNKSDSLIFFLIFLVLGISVLGYGILIQTGKIKSWWLLRSNPIVPEAAAYLGIPFSISLFVLATAAFFPDIETRRRILFFAIFISLISFLLAVWRPSWLTPKWLLWLEKYHDDILSLLREEARVLGGREWSKRVHTQEDLEIWVAEVRRKHRL
jgi:hypothetical protein